MAGYRFQGIKIYMLSQQFLPSIRQRWQCFKDGINWCVTFYWL